MEWGSINSIHDYIKNKCKLNYVERVFSKHYGNDYEPFLDTIGENTFKQIQCDQQSCYNNKAWKVLPKLSQVTYSIHTFSLKTKAKIFHICDFELERLYFTDFSN